MVCVDIAIPCYQHGHYLRDCVESVLQQGVNDIRLLIIDNASTDNSAEVAHALARKDDRIDVSLHRTNLGPHASFNEGVDWAEADYFMVLCSDDLLAPNSLKDMVDVMERHPDTSFAYGNDVHWRDGEARPDVHASVDDWRIRDGRDFILDRCRAPERYIAAGMVLTRTSAHKKAGHYRRELPHTDDLEMLLRLATFGRVADCQRIFGIKRIHAHNRTHVFLAERTQDLIERHAALESFFSREGQSMPDWKLMRAKGRRGISERAYWCGIKDLAHGRWSGIDLLKLAIQLSPRTAIIPPFGYLSRMERTLAESIRHE